jgi:nicotinamide mononucleotide adenylyltransferase
MRIGIYLGSFKPMHIGHEQVLFKVAELNDYVLFFPGFGAKGVKKAKKQKRNFYKSLPGQAMMTDDIAEKQFRMLRIAIQNDPELNKIKIVMPGETVNGYTAATGPVFSAVDIANALSNHYVENKGDMSNVYIPFLDMFIDNPQVRLYSDVTDSARVSKSALLRYKLDPIGVEGIFMRNFIPVGIQRGESNVSHEYEPAEFETTEISATDLRRRIRNLENLSDPEFEMEVEEIASLMPGILSTSEKMEFLRTIQRLDKERRSGVFRDELPPLPEGIKRKSRNDEEYGSYLEEIMNELQHIKKEYGSRTKAGSRYRLEANKLQGAYSELRKLKRKHEKQMENDQMLSERAIRRATGHDDYHEKDEVFNRDSIRDFFNKFK